ncbi:bifunctional enoyl-CoA hydratase/phosphate acetyltransferase [candidate division WOR-3 bacterium]|nr:bifunctional enoyl-CoA hydratase/phosphate acetyltransferase [candidate division WOR-3 bacterium]
MTDFKQLIESVKSKGPKRIVVSGGEDPVSIEALKWASNLNLVEPILVGNKEKIKELTQEFEIIDATSEEIPIKSTELVKSGKADILMKGKISTADFLHGVLDKDAGLRTGRTLSHIAVMESPLYHKLFLVTDGGINIKPNLQGKIDILMNAVEFAYTLGIDYPKVAVLAAIEKVNPDMQETLDADELSKMAIKGKFGKCKVEGPLALDLAVSEEACKIKGIESEVSGDADILLMPDIACGNITAKALLYLGGAKIGGIVVGAKAPCVMLSRADSKEIKLNSIALGVIATDK